MKVPFHTMILVLSIAGATQTFSAADVTVIRTPDEGIQPQAAVDASGTIHLIYYKGDAAAGDVFYVKRPATSEQFSAPIQVNSQRGSVIAAGSIRGAQLALGKNGRVHVVWDGMGKGARKVAINGKEVAPLLYTRLNDAGTDFEPERNVITFAAGLDGGSSVAADLSGNVYVAWHATPSGNHAQEAERAVFVARSSDDGKTFQREQPAVAKKTGACACCGMRAFADSRGAVYILFRAATDNTERGQTLLVSPSPGADFKVAFSHPWKANQCPMSSTTLTETKGVVLAAWETADQVFFASVDPATMAVSRPTAPAVCAKRKHPVAVGNAGGDVLLAWTEGTAWGKGGTVSWQQFSRDGKPVGERGRGLGMPAWSIPTAVTTSDGNFIVIY